VAESPAGVTNRENGTGGGQLGLFGEEAPASRRASRQDADSAGRLAREHETAAAIAARLPEKIFLGTSSWSYPEWEGIVYSRRQTPAQLAREGLSEYARHPLLTTVGIDRSFYAPIPREDLQRYAGQLPAGFPCCLKAPQAVTSAVAAGPAGQSSRGANPDYLEPARFMEEIAAPVLEVFEEHAGPVILQFPPVPSSFRPTPGAFAERLGRFLAALPKSLSYAVELREPSLLTNDYRETLAANGAAHVYNYSGTMPMPAEQAEIVPIGTAPFVVVRLLMPPGNRYEERREALAPFNRLSAPDDRMRREVAALALAAAATHRPVSILVNNKAEGCSPLTIRAFAEILAGEPLLSSS
jgi:uncharacterized protein YecE (DUF72 family)